jgi:hypothetical protein
MRRRLRKPQLAGYQQLSWWHRACHPMGVKQPAHISNQAPKWMAILLLAGAHALAQEHRTARRIVVSIPDRKLVLLEGDRVLRIYDIAVGRSSSPSPEGEFQVVTRIPHPTWYHAGKVVPPGKSNPLGTRWLGLSIKGYGIHGTNVPRSIGKSASHGCIRMRNRDVEELFELVTVGIPVELAGSRSAQLEKILAVAD